MDGHSSHFGPAFIETAVASDVIVFCLPPNTTHFLQPLDNGPFGQVLEERMSAIVIQGES